MIQVEMRIPCVICGYLLGLLRWAEVRVNKRSIRGKVDQAHLVIRLFPLCPECGDLADLNGKVTGRASISPESIAEIDAYRFRRWPELAEAG